MRYLLDTHVLIWTLTGDSRADSVKMELIDSSNEVFFSSVSIWEIAIKYTSGKLSISPAEAIEYSEKQRFTELPMYSMHAAAITSLRYPENIPLHKDPFDNMLIAQAKTEGLNLLTADEKIAVYLEPCIKLLVGNDC